MLPDGLLDGLEGLEGLVERFCVLPGAELGLPVDPEEAVLPPEAGWLSRLHPASSAPESANETPATNAVTFMLTSVVGVIAGEQFMDRTFIQVILHTDHDGRAKFREARVPLTEGTPQARLSALLPATGYQLRHSPVGFRSSFHCTPQPQWVFILGGEMEIGLQDGSSRLFRPGEHFFSADVLPPGAAFDPKVHGHCSAQRGPHPLVTLFLKV